MLRLIIFCLSLISIGELYGQTIGYGLSYGLPYSTNQVDFISADFNKTPEIGLVLALNDENKLIDQAELRFSTYATHLKTSDNFSLVTSSSDINLRYYNIDLQTFIFNLNLKHLGNIYLGSKVSYTFRSSVEGQYVLSDGQIDIIESFEYERESKFKVFLSLRYSAGTINLGNGLKLYPTYTFDYSRNNDFPQHFFQRRNTSHTFGLMIIKTLEPKRHF